jgi:hypothetical protein
MEKTINALLIAGASGIFIVVLVQVARWVSRQDWPPSRKGGIVGCVFGLITAAVIMRKVPLATQMLVIGAIAGIGTDFVATLKEPGGPKTVIERVAKMISGMVIGVGAAAADTGLEKPEEKLIAGGLWTFLGAILFTLIVGNLF